MKNWLQSLLGKWFEPSPTVAVPYEQLATALRIGSPLYISTPDMVLPMSQHLGFNIVGRHGCICSYFVDPDEYLYLMPQRQDFADVPAVTLAFRSSAHMTIQRLRNFWGQEKCAVMITAKMTKFQDLEVPPVFGLTGTLADDGKMLAIDQIFLPDMEGRRIKSLTAHRPDSQNVALALHFARLCAEQLFARREMDVYGNLFYAKRAFPVAPKLA